jgi:hypothetical protein
MIWSVPEEIEYLSHFYTIEPGDLIYSGTPAGVGPVQPGDELHATIEHVGELKGQDDSGAVKLYTFFRGSSPFRVRTRAELKGLAYESAFVHPGKRRPAQA